MTLIACLETYFSDFGILERHNQLENTIGALNMEKESFERAQLFSWIFFPSWIVLTLVQIVCYILSNGRFHPLSDILTGWDDQDKLLLSINCLTYNLFVSWGFFIVAIHKQRKYTYVYPGELKCQKWWGLHPLLISTSFWNIIRTEKKISKNWKKKSVSLYWNFISVSL